jgi:hypothetical protein
VSRQVKWAIALMAAGCLGGDPCLAQTHPDTTRYEYLFMNGSFVAPYTAFPTGRERGRWKCYDGRTGTTFDCTFVRGGFDQFQYIFRAR